VGNTSIPKMIMMIISAYTIERIAQIVIKYLMGVMTNVETVAIKLVMDVKMVVIRLVMDVKMIM